MKIDKLYTLSQFVDSLLEDATEEELKDEWWMSSAFMYIVAYLNFLKQPLKKEMFVNEFGKKPIYAQWTDISKKYYEWQQAEKKVVFKNTPNIELDTLLLENKDGYTIIDTLATLAEATNGELELQNVEI